LTENLVFLEPVDDLPCDVIGEMPADILGQIAPDPVPAIADSGAAFMEVLTNGPKGPFGELAKGIFRILLFWGVADCRNRGLAAPMDRASCELEGLFWDPSMTVWLTGQEWQHRDELLG